jgi:hypothetical protein
MITPRLIDFELSQNSVLWKYDEKIRFYFALKLANKEEYETLFQKFYFNSSKHEIIFHIDFSTRNSSLIFSQFQYGNDEIDTIIRNILENNLKLENYDLESGESVIDSLFLWNKNALGNLNDIYLKAINNNMTFYSKKSPDKTYFRIYRINLDKYCDEIFEEVILHFQNSQIRCVFSFNWRKGNFSIFLIFVCTSGSDLEILKNYIESQKYKSYFSRITNLKSNFWNILLNKPGLRLKYSKKKPILQDILSFCTKNLLQKSILINNFDELIEMICKFYHDLEIDGNIFSFFDEKIQIIHLEKDHTQQLISFLRKYYMNSYYLIVISDENIIKSLEKDSKIPSLEKLKLFSESKLTDAYEFIKNNFEMIKIKNEERTEKKY